jgi:hypothetical protein
MEPNTEAQTEQTKPVETAPEVATPTKTHQHTAIFMVVGGVVFGVCVGLFISTLMNAQSESEWKKTLAEVAMPEEIVEQYEPADYSEWNTKPDGYFEETGKVYNDGIYIDDTDYSMYYKNLADQAGVTWLARPEKIADQGLIFLDPEVFSSGHNVTYLKLGTVNDSDIIMSIIPCSGMCFSDEVIMLLRIGTKFSILKKYSSILDFNDLRDYSFNIRGDVALDSSTSLIALDVTALPFKGAALQVGKDYNGKIIYSPYSPLSSSDDQGSEFLVDTSFGPLFMETNYMEEGVVRAYHVRTAPGLWVEYDLPFNFIGDDGVPQITWLDGTSNTTYYRSGGMGGCGLGGATEQAATRVEMADLTLAGTTSDGKAVYSISNEKHPLVRRIFAMTDGIVYEYQDGVSSTYTITPAQFVAERGVLIIEDDLGYQNIFNHGTYGPQAECAKPVIYLYPESTTEISVGVDAIVTKSEPAYNTGWITTATREGTLTMADGSTYTSLFWDGYGRGEYPVLTKGFVVKTEDAISTMEEHLRIMGFNDTEIADFSDYWTPLMPTTPYTKFSWLQTKEMNELARLTIEPRPDTLLRAFVDFTGVENLETIEPQTLQTVPRRGYTATEWGGLLRK